eukprot:g3637.t1
MFEEPRPITNEIAFSSFSTTRSICASGCRFILVVEKEAVFARLMEENFTSRFPGILVTGKGYPDLASRAFVAKLARELRLPVYGLCDWNPSGVTLMLCYKIGSARFCYGGRRYACPSLRWVGVRRRDVLEVSSAVSGSSVTTLTKSGTASVARPPLPLSEIALARGLLKRDFFRLHPRWADEVKAMIEDGRKCDIEMLYPRDHKGPSHAGDYASGLYRKICKGDSLE